MDYKNKYCVSVNDINEGRFALILTEDNYITIKADTMGQEIIYYYKSNRYWAISNSFYYLCLYIKNKGLQRNIYLPSLLSFYISNGGSMGAQPISNNTAIEQVKVLPLGCEIKINKRNRKIKIVKPFRIKFTKKQLNMEQYVESLLNYYRKWAPRIVTLLNPPFKNIAVDLSGGYDTRIALGMVIASGVSTNDLRIHSSLGKSNLDDYTIAQEISKHYGLNMSRSYMMPITNEASDAYELWKMGNLGVYLPIYYPVHSIPNLNSMEITGDGGEINRYFYRHNPKKTKTNIERYITDKNHCKMVQKEFINSFKGIGVNINGPYAMNAHYINYRSRFHFGRHWYRSIRYLGMPIFAPLLCPDLMNIMKSLPSEMLETKQTVCDMLLLLDPLLAKTPFDKEEKNFPLEMLQNLASWGDNTFNNGLFEPLEIFYAVDNEHVKTLRKPSDPVTPKKFLEHFVKDYEELKYKALSLGTFSDEYIQNADQEIMTCERQSADLRKATHIYFAGSMVDIVAD